MDAQTVIVVGATGGVGEGAVRALLDRSISVIAVGRSQPKLDELRDRLDPAGPGSLTLLECDVTAADSARVTAQILNVVNMPVDGVVISIGTTGWPEPAELLKIPDEHVQSSIARNEVGGIRALRALVPCVRRDGAVVNLLGYSAEIPFPRNPLLASTQAALRSLLRSLAVQLAGTGPRVYALILGMVRTRARQDAGIDNVAWLTGEEVGDYAADLISGTVERPGHTVRYLVSRTDGPTMTPPSSEPAAPPGRM